MKPSARVVALATAALSALPSVVLATEEGPENPAPFNVSVTSDYRYRGISQSRLKPALQGGYDYSHKSGWYLGTWASTIKWIKDAGGDASIEWDLYGGFKGAVTKDVGYDVGVLAYVYPGNKLSPSANTTEVYGALTFGPATLKYSHSVTNLFGFGNSKNSGYLDASATFDLGNGWTVIPHVGHQSVSHFSRASYTDYSLIVGKDIGNGFNASVGLVGTDADKSVYVAPSGKFLGRSAVTAMLKFNF